MERPLGPYVVEVEQVMHEVIQRQTAAMHWNDGAELGPVRPNFQNMTQKASGLTALELGPVRPNSKILTQNAAGLTRAGEA